MSEQLDRWLASSPLYGGNAAFIEDLFERFLVDPSSIPPDWSRRFQSLPPVNGADVSHRAIVGELRDLAERGSRAVARGFDVRSAAKQAAVLRLINAYRVRGHQNAKLDPLGLQQIEPLPELDLAHHGLEQADLAVEFYTGSLFAPDRLPLAQILEIVREVYTRTLGIEFMHITSTEEKRWIQQRVETYRGHPELTDGDRRWFLKLLTAAEGLEKYLHTVYVGQKRFSLEGAESLIPMLDELIQRAGRNGVEELVIGMAHRGRLNVLTNIIGKPPAEIYEEFKGVRRRHRIMTSGDVKYHMGFSGTVETPGGFTHVTLAFNPSHLEIIGPVVEGSVRLRQHRRADSDHRQVVPVIIHGDAAFAGQGVVMETFNMSQARGFTTGGTVHIVVNNQIGFTTSDVMDSRSTTYCTDVAKMVQAPILHVNGDDPEAVIFATRMAFDYRNHFRKDVVLDLVCYRRHGHNEADEPAVTQPLMYQKIRQHPPVRALYADELIARGIITPEDAKSYSEQYRSELEHGQIVSRPVLCGLENPHRIDWSKYDDACWDQPVATRVSRERLQLAGLALLELPEGFVLHPRVDRILSDRRRMALGEQPSDWGFGETLAYATLLEDGYSIRISGQDCRRGTFFHRHAALIDQVTGAAHIPLAQVQGGQVDFTIIDSLLSEEAVLAFEYGYATADPTNLTIWEAQFGDFANGAQVVIDQFISSAGSKWGLYCGLTLFLPHGYEGQGPEHSSARVERYMQLCAEQNIQLCLPTTPAQIFHLLRRQMLRPFRRPLIVFTPKSLLRHPLATSPLDAYCCEEGFETVIDEQEAIDRSKVNLVILCCGKIYYDLLQARRAQGLNQVALIRLEQLYPFPRPRFDAVIAGYPQARNIVWCQEEPQNQGAWDQIKHRFARLRKQGREIYYVGRPSAAAPATGFHKVHEEEQHRLVDDALNGRFDPVMNQRNV